MAKKNRKADSGLDAFEAAIPAPPDAEEPPEVVAERRAAEDEVRTPPPRWSDVTVVQRGQ
jgi:hypothetical protein